MLQVRRWVGPVASLILAAQAAAAVGVTVAGHQRRRLRRPHRFPTSAPLPAEAGDNSVTIYTFGKDLFADMLRAIDEATTSVRLETFIWKGDEVGQEFKDAVERAAARGVTVHLIIDQFANLVVPQSFYGFSDRIRVRWHPLIGPIGRIDHRNGGRDHRKLLIVDGTVAFLGGYNIGSLYADKWRDTHARFTGPIVTEIDNAFVDQWNITPRGLTHRSNRAFPLEASSGREWATDIRIHRNTPRMAVYPIRNMYLEAIDRASKSIHITQAYFVPDDDFLASLFAAARRGVDVSIIIPAESNHVLADWLSRGVLTTNCSPAASGSSSTRGRWCMRRPERSTASGRRSARRTSTGSACSATTRSTPRSRARGWHRGWRRSSRSTSPTAWN